MPIILGSDKTTVSVATGQNEYWPLYASIGNIHNNVRRAHGSGLILVGFLSIPKGVFFRYYSDRLRPAFIFFIIKYQSTRLNPGLLSSGNFAESCFMFPYRLYWNRFAPVKRNLRIFDALTDIIDV